jgi:hypothetical protein
MKTNTRTLSGIGTHDVSVQEIKAYVSEDAVIGSGSSFFRIFRRAYTAGATIKGHVYVQKIRTEI